MHLHTVLKYRCLDCLSTAKKNIVHHSSESPAYKLHAQSLCQSIDRILVQVSNKKTLVELVFLSWLIDVFCHSPHSFIIDGVFSIITIDEKNALIVTLKPVLNKILYFCLIHKLQIIHVPVFLSFNLYEGWYAFWTHAFWIWLMIHAVFLYWVIIMQANQAIRAFLVRSVIDTVVKIELGKLVKRNVLNIFALDC